MVQYRDLNAPPAKKLADIVAGMRDQAKSSKTGSAGVKDLGVSGDVVWSRPDESLVSVRDIDAELVDAVGRIEDAEQESAGLAQRVTDAEASVGAVASDLDTLETVTLPNAVSSLEAADEAAREDLTALDGRLTTAQTDLDAAEASLATLGTDLLAETAAREALDASVRADLGTLDDKLVTAFPSGVFDVSAELAQTIRASVIEYAVSESESTAPATGWATTTPVRAAGEFIWFRTVITYADNTTSTSSPALLTGNAGAPGEPGPAGEDGTSVTILGTLASEADLPATGNSAGDGYLIDGYLHVWTGSTWENVGLIQGPAGADGAQGPKGDKGDTGAAGIGVASVRPYYQRLASGSAAPAKPTTVTPTGWASTEPAWQTGTELWRTERIVYSDATFAYTDVTKVAVFAGIDAAMAAANGKSKVTYTDLADASKPGPAPAVDNSRAAGDIHRNRRASTGEIWAEYQWTGTQWKPVSFGDSVLTSLDVGKLSAGTASIQSGVIDQLWADGIMAKSVATTSVTVSASNLLPDPNGNTSVGREAYANLGFVWDEAVTGWTRTPPAVSNQTKPNAGGDYTSYPLEGGRVYRLSFEAYVAGGTGDARYAIYYTRRDGTTAFVNDQIEAGYDTALYTPVPADKWTRVERAWIAPDDAVVGGFALQVSNVSSGATRVSIRKPYAGVMHGGVHIENGAITADKIQAESVAGAVGEFIVLSTDQLTAGSASIGSAVAQRFWADIAAFNQITADSVVVGGVDRDAIADGAVGAVKIEDGAITTPKLTVTEDMSAAIVDAMSVNAKELIVTEEAILNHATLIGQTVVDDINIQGKLIGTDGVFTGTVDFENVNVTGGAIVEKLSGNTLSGVTVTAGSSDGSRTMTLRDNVLFGQPGIEFNSAIAGAISPPNILGYGEEGEDTSATMKGAITVRSAFGLAAGNSQLTVAPASVRMSRWSTGSNPWTSRVSANAASSSLYFGRDSGANERYGVYAADGSAYMGHWSDADNYVFLVDDRGPRFNRWTTGSPTTTAPLTPDIVPFDVNAWWDVSDSPTGGIIVTHSLAGRYCRARLRLRRVGETFVVNTSFQEFGGRPIPPSLRTALTDYIPVRVPATGNAGGVLYIDYSTSRMLLRTTSGTVNFSEGAVMYATLEWFIPN